MTQVLLLNPPRRADGGSAFFNNATLSLASYLRHRGVSARTEPLLGPFWLDQLEKLLSRHQPEVVAISCKWWDTLFGAVELARLVRERAPGVKLVTGGQTATYFAQDLVAKTEFDAVVRGDGEQPLLEFVQGDPSCNLTLKGGTELPTKYVQSHLDDLRFFPDMAEIADPTMLRAVGYNAPYVWTGKGCRYTCLYCAGSALGHKRMFGRKGYLYRPIDQVLHDMEVLAPWSQNTVLFDFDPVNDPDMGHYYFDLFRELPEKKYHCYFYCWSLPEPEFVELLAERFASAFVSFDAQAYSEAHRRRLAEKRMIKPFRSNQEFEEMIDCVGSYSHLDAGIYGILGLAGEQPQDIVETERWIAHLLTTYGDVLGELAVTPLSTEPGSLVHRNPDKYGMNLVRSSFEDYLEITRLKYFGDRSIHDQPYDVHLPHPYGLYSQGERPDRVFHDYQRINSRIEATFEGRQSARLKDDLKFFVDRVQLRLHNRNRIRACWHLVMWAAGVAREKGYKKLIVDATDAFVHVPEKEVMELTGTHDYTLNRLPGLQRAIESGQFELVVEGREGQFWGAYRDLGAKILI